MRTLLINRAVAVAALAGLLAAGCGDPNNCRSGTALVIYTLSGPATGADQLIIDVSVDGAPGKQSTLGLHSGQNHAAFEVTFPSGYPAGKSVDVTITAVRAGQGVASDSKSVTAPASCAKLELTVGDPTSGGDSDMGDDLGGGGPDACVPAMSCPATVGCGTISDGCSGTLDCGPCQLTALTPPIAATDDSVLLEGTFSDSAMVTFPGNVAVAATILGPHRAKVTVPAGATIGGLTVMTGTQSIGPLPFHHARHTLDVMPFAPRYEQTTGAHSMAAFTAPRSSTAIVAVGNVLYAIGGYGNSGALATVERALVNADGTVNPFSAVAGVNLSGPRAYLTAAVIGPYVYVFGGGPTGSPLATVERATINADGSLGPFAVVSGVTLAAARQQHCMAIVGNSIYILGGASTTTLSSIERATINPDGSITTFTALTGTLAVARASAGCTVAGNTLLVAGGNAGGGAFNTVESAPIMGDGTLGAFATSSKLMTLPRLAPAVVRVAGNLVVIGGRSGAGEVATVEHAPLAADGSLAGAFSTSTVSLNTPRAFHSALVVGDYLFVAGGVSNNVLQTSFERASLNATGVLNPPTKLTTTLSTPRGYHVNVVLGNYAYAVGGNNASTLLNTIDRAALGGDGTPGAFAAVTGVTLATGKNSAASAISGNYLYLLGGSDTAYSNTVQRATINSDGTIASFAVVGSSLSTPRAYASAVIIEPYIYVIGGITTGGVESNTVERATLGSDYSFGTFATVAGVTLATGRSEFGALVLGNQLWVCDGQGTGAPSDLRSCEVSTINSDGTIGTFSTTATSGVTARSGLAVAFVGRTAYIIAGYNGLALGSIEKTAVGPDGTFGNFSTAPAGTALVVPRFFFSSFMAGDALYVAGGYANGSNATIEQATY